MGEVGSDRVTKDPILEAISDKIRMGEPVDYLEAIAAINYQEQLRREREANSLIRRFMCGFWRGLSLQFLWRKK